MLLQDPAKIHLVELVAGKNEDQPVRIGIQVHEILPHRVGRALIPVHAARALFRGQDLHEPGREGVEPVALLDVPVEGAAVELGEQEDPAQVGIEAVADGDVHQPVLARQGHGRLGPVLGEREQPRARTASHDHCEDIMCADGDVPGHGGIRVAIG